MNINNNQYTVLISSNEVMKDGVAQYVAQLSKSMVELDPDRVVLEVFDFKGFFRSINFLRKFLLKSKVFHLQYPMELWGQSVNPGITFFLAYFLVSSKKRSKIVVTLHEWNSMHILRKLSIVPLIMIVDTVIFVSPTEEAAFWSSFLGKFSHLRTVVSQVIPIGVNLAIPKLNNKSVLEKRAFLENIDKKTIVIGYFGFIYDWKQPYKLLDMVDAFVKKGVDVKFVIAGSFPEDHLRQKKKFEDYIKYLDIQDNVYWPGYIEDEMEVSDLLSACNLVMALYEDGLTSRRGSFWYLVELGTPVITTRPINKVEFDQSMMDRVSNCSVSFVETNVTKDELVELISTTYQCYKLPVRMEKIAPAWDDIGKKHIELYSQVSK